MTEHTLETTIGDDDLPITVEFEYFPGTPAKLSGPMEDCYPAEECTLEINEIITEVGYEYLQYDIIDLIDDSWIKYIEQKCLDYVAATGE